MSATSELFGQRREDLDTPVLLVELPVFEANLAQLAGYCRQHQVDWRPHSKAHKSPEIAALQLAAGACGITCAKLSEAETMVEYGLADILIANQVVAPAKLRRLAALQHRARVAVALDEARVAGMLGQAAAAEGVVVPVLLEVDIGMDRAGVLPGPPVLELARVVHGTSGLSLLGLMGYEGHILDLKPPEVKATACRQALDLLVESRDLLERSGIPVQVVSAGGTGSYRLAAAHPGVTELQAGGGIFMDAMYQERLSVDDLGCALTILATVTSRHERHVVVDAGFKTMSAFHCPPRALGSEDLRLRYLSAEHGVWDIAEGQRGPSVGERVEFVVGYGDSTNFLHDRFLGMRHGRVETVWPILGRGKLS